jgi:AraC family carnitine catabolism transcriptional activator
MSLLIGDSQKSPVNFAFVVLSKFGALTLSSLVEPLRIANYCAGQNLYDWRFLSADGEDVPASAEIRVKTEKVSVEDTTPDVIIVCGGWNAERYDNSNLLSWLQIMGRQGVILGAADTGTYILGRAGLLSGYAATIHWHCHKAFGELYPETELRDSLYVIDRKRMTCAGGTACLDMMLQEIDQRYGNALALEVADQLVHFPHRQAGVTQKEVQSRKQASVPPALQKAIDLMGHNIERPLTIPDLARNLGFSQRKLERLFNKHFGCSAVAFYRVLRLQEARVLLTHTDMSVLDICIACGFASSSYFSKSYTNQFGVRPRDHRTSWPDDEPSPYWPGVATSTITSNQAGQEKTGE